MGGGGRGAQCINFLLLMTFARILIVHVLFISSFISTKKDL